MIEEPCPCETFVHPRVISNPAGRILLDYRVGDYTSFRHALLQSRDGEKALENWHPTADGDLAVQLLEWWAYLADVLAFYNERALHEVLLRTAVLPDHVRKIIRLLGYRPRPGIAATGLVAALADSARPFVLPQGFSIQASIEGKPPQVFELDEDIEIGLIGKPLRASAGVRMLAESTTPTSNAWVGYPARDKRGRIRNKFPARPKQTKTLPSFKPGQPTKVAVKGVVTNVSPDDVILVLKRDWTGDLKDQLPFGSALAAVHELLPQWDEHGLPITVLTLHPGQELPAGSQRADYRFLKSTKIAHLWLYHERYPGMKTPNPVNQLLQGAESFFDPLHLFSPGMSSEPPQDPHVLTSQVMFAPPFEGAAHLEAITRGIVPGDPVLFEQKELPGTIPGLFMSMIGKALPQLAALKEQLFQSTYLAKVTGYSELIWYANPPEGDRIGQGPPVGPPGHSLISGGAAPIPIPHSKITFNDPFQHASRMSKDDLDIRTVVVHYGWQEIGEITDTPSTDDTTDPTTQPEVPHPAEVPPGTRVPVVIEDATGAGVLGFLGETNSDGRPLVPPLEALINLLPVSRGETVEREVLGTGDPILINQELVLARWPLTYLADPSPGSIDGYRSTLRIRVNGIEWHEVATFYGQRADARVFVTREDDQQRTYVRFGDGEFGARLPGGIDNVVAHYRVGSGAEVPPVGALTTILKPRQGLQAIRNPIAPGGGADPDPPEQIRRYAPRSALTFGRAISGDDYETLAAQTPGVRRARVRWGWDPTTQRTLVKVFVGDDASAVVAARAALRACTDPNRPVIVQLASPIYADLSLTLELDPDYDTEMVKAAAIASLLDPQAQPFGLDVARIEEVVYDSEIYDACLQIPGVLAVHGLAFRIPIVDAPRSPVQPPSGFSPQYTMFSSILDQLHRFDTLPAAPTSDEEQLAALRLQILKLEAESPELVEYHAPQIDALKAQALALEIQILAAQDAGAPAETLLLETVERHTPGEGRFYLLKADRLHISTDIGRHGH